MISWIILDNPSINDKYFKILYGFSFFSQWIDCTANCLCILFSFNFQKKWYAICCALCHKYCNLLCTKYAEKKLENHNGSDKELNFM